MITKSEYYREFGIRLVGNYKTKPAIVIGLWKYVIRIEL